MKVSYKVLLARTLRAIFKVFSVAIIACAAIIICITLLVAGFHFGMPLWLHIAGYSDEALYSKARECVVNKVDVDQINEEAKKVFADDGWEEVLRKLDFYDAPEDSCLGRISRELSQFEWQRTLVAGSNALVLPFGCHYKRVALIIVDPANRICYNDGKVKRITDNIGVCFDPDLIGTEFSGCPFAISRPTPTH